MISLKEQIEMIIHYSAQEFKINPKLIKQKNRKGDVPMARHIAIALSVRTCQPTISLKEIGQHFGGRDHSTVISSCKRADDYFQVDAKFRMSVNNIVRKIQRRLQMPNKLKYCNQTSFQIHTHCVSG